MITDGDSDRIEIKNSNNTRILNVTARNIYIERSIVSIESSSIKSGDIGVKVIDSVANLSGCSIDSDVAVLTSNSSVDLAGVKLTGKTAAIKEAALKSEDKSTIIFSISKIKSPAYGKCCVSTIRSGMQQASPYCRPVALYMDSAIISDTVIN